ncbi:Uncharacterized protein HZ326_21214 [Fusarium oxysporum f. sp. albedinis]|nr:Uncharacterized protein HZ326_21214 [Fusarium oxysporum f. sp. albedinis]
MINRGNFSQLGYIYRLTFMSVKLVSFGGAFFILRSERGAVDGTGQVGEYFTGGALNAGQDVAIRVQDPWPNFPRPFNRGIWVPLANISLRECIHCRLRILSFVHKEDD